MDVNIFKYEALSLPIFSTLPPGLTLLDNR